MGPPLRPLRVEPPGGQCVSVTDQSNPADCRLFEGVPYHYGAVAPPGAILFTAGACPLDAAGNVVGPGDPIAQATAALENLIAALDLHDAGPEHLVRTTIYVVGERDDLVRVWN